MIASNRFSNSLVTLIGGLVLSIAASPNLASGQTRPPAPSRTFTLHEVASNRLAVPPFPTRGPAHCDGAGNVYFAVDSSILGKKAILRISEDGENAKPFVLPDDLGMNWALYVSPSGDLYALFEKDDGSANTLIEMSESGEELRRTVWQVPKDLYVYSFVVLPGGRAMVRGQLPLPENPRQEDQKAIEPTAPYTAWLAADGRPIREINGLADGGKPDAPTAWRASAIAPGPGETFVSTFGNSLNVYSSAGLLLHSSPITRPDDDATPSLMQFADGLMAVDFEQPVQVDISRPASSGSDNDGPTREALVLKTTWQLISPADGLSHGFFKMPDDFRGSSLCYLGKDNFLYLTVRDRHPELIRAQPK